MLKIHFRFSLLSSQTKCFYFLKQQQLNYQESIKEPTCQQITIIRHSTDCYIRFGADFLIQIYHKPVKLVGKTVYRQQKPNEYLNFQLIKYHNQQPFQSINQSKKHTIINYYQNYCQEKQNIQPFQKTRQNNKKQKTTKKQTKTSQPINNIHLSPFICKILNFFVYVKRRPLKQFNSFKMSLNLYS
ncbi:hypothetical protein ABPG72_022704 [Tetrahymena utriculariae]